MISLDKEDWIILQPILQKYPYNIYAYGSRVKGNHKKFSALDLCIIESIDNNKLFDLQQDLEESNLSIKVDIKKWYLDMDKNFQSLIEKDLTPLNIYK